MNINGVERVEGVRLHAVADMAAATTVYGLNNVFMHSAHYACIWCRILRAHIADFSIFSHGWRDLNHMHEVGESKEKLKESTRAAKAAKNRGVIVCVLIECACI